MTAVGVVHVVDECCQNVATTPAWSEAHSPVLVRSAGSAPTTSTTGVTGGSTPSSQTTSIRLERAEVELRRSLSWQQVKPGAAGSARSVHASVKPASRIRSY